MVEIVKLWLQKEVLISLEDHFENNDKQTLHNWFFVQLRELAKTSKLSDANRAINANVFTAEGGVEQKPFKYKDIDLESFKLESDPTWRPKDLEDDELSNFDLKVGEKTHNHLSNYCKIHAARIHEFNESIPQKDGVKDEKYKVIPMPKCFEEIVNASLVQPVQNLLMKIASELFDEENKLIEQAQKEDQEKIDKIEKSVQK